MNSIVIKTKLESLRKCLDRIESKKPESLDDLIQDIGTQDILALNLERSIQLCVDIANQFSHLKDAAPVYRDFRIGDVRHSLADITKGKELIGYNPKYRINEGLKEAMEWYVGFMNH